MNNENEHDELDAGQEFESILLIDDHEEEVSEDGRKVRRKGIFLLPNLLTTGALFAGFFAVISGMNNDFHNACMAILAAMFLDGLDGRVARLTNTESAFGAEYDSLSDLLAFGIAPALICFSWALSDLGTLGWTAAFFYVACAALRLARFNVQLGTVSKRFFVGLASPAAAGLVVFMVWVCDEYGVEVTFPVAVVAALVTTMAGLLMVLNVHYYSFKDMDFKKRVPFFVILMVILLFVIVSWDPPVVLFVIAILYALSGPVLTFYQYRKNKTKKADVIDEVAN
ncbi:MAG: CDP-diacylglycerol--serine O-phosphatidyltransferase [SAR86 cluster bacterium]|uniref:CDP-diacylglycerol--serine O-phosphatidyltransferase n=1 Tax=SAR86 cluster bacterium TaxID=2030880 RepID=A0A2A5CHM2_9GAMM|nr:CDP-diacylglycerol--serine O-phosphatidyltransferase [Gammaproteobacteria bacterium AH-315-E17]PCJ42940.1 MAG: CDP-diacylglycerol--serine O-phosphatidyltransferase [SAR86 cluster bacterium]